MLHMVYHNLDLSQYTCSVAAGVEIVVLGQRFQCNCEGEEVIYSSVHSFFLFCFVIFARA